MVGKTLLHYEILQKIGSGGLGEEYRAREVRDLESATFDSFKKADVQASWGRVSL